MNRHDERTLRIIVGEMIAAQASVCEALLRLAPRADAALHASKFLQEAAAAWHVWSEENVPADEEELTT